MALGSADVAPVRATLTSLRSDGITVVCLPPSAPAFAMGGSSPKRCGVDSTDKGRAWGRGVNRIIQCAASR